MTMHLVGPYLTTTNYRKRKTKVTQAQMNRWIEGHKEKNKQNKRLGLPQISFDDYVDALHGRIKREKPKFTPMTNNQTDPTLERIRKHKEMYPSLNSSNFDPAACAKKAPQQYTGTLIKGIATMHKSNAVPVINDDQAKEISSMRR